MTPRQLLPLCFASGSVLLAACSAAPAPAAQTAASAASTLPAISAVVDHALARANAKLQTQDLTLSERNDAHAYPEASITPQGDLLIGGKAVTLTPAQRTEMLAYRQQLLEVAEAGLAVGRQGAALGVRATSVALAAVFSGKSEQQVRQQVEAETSGIRAAAGKICDRLPALLASQQKLAADVPAFRPYASMTQQDIDDCHRGARQHAADASQAEAQPSTRDRIRRGIRSGVQIAAQKTGLAQAGTRDVSPAVPASAAVAATSRRP